MTAGKHQSQSVVLQLLVKLRYVVRIAIETIGDLGLGRIEADTAANAIDRLETTGGDQPCTWIAGNAIPRPLFDGRAESVVQRFFREIEIAEHANQGGKHTARF